MYKNSHRALGVALIPVLFIKTGIEKYDSFIYNSFSSDMDILKYILFWIIYMYGTTFPDLDLKLKYLYPKRIRHQRYLYHRQLTHSLLLSIGALYYSLFHCQSEYYMFLTAFSLGIIAHQIGDMLTGSIPWLFYGSYYVRFSRIGITVFLPKAIHQVFTVKFPKWCNKNLYIFFILFCCFLSIHIWLYFK